MIYNYLVNIAVIYGKGVNDSCVFIQHIVLHLFIHRHLPCVYALVRGEYSVRNTNKNIETL